MQRRTSFILLFLLALAVVTVGCASESRATESAVQFRVDSAPAAAPEAANGEYGFSAETGAFDGNALELTAGGAADRMIIQTANIGLEVKDTEASVTTIVDMVSASGGYVANSNRWYSGEDLRASLVLRVPAESLDSIMEALRDLAVRVENESTSGEDVTEEYVDIQARLRNLEAAESELLELLADARESGGEAEDILAIYREITSIRAEIESLKGRETYLENKVSMATIYVEVWPEDAPASVVDEKWKPLVTASRAAKALWSAITGLGDILIYIVVLSPIIALPFVIVWLLVRSLKKKKQRDQGNS